MIYLSIEQSAYLAGIMDSDGSLSLSYHNSARYYQLRMATKDKVIAPTISSWLGVSFKPDSRNMLCIELISAQQIKDVLTQIYPYLYTKQPRAKLMLDAINIKNGHDSHYSPKESEEWDKLKLELNRLNGFGHKQSDDDYERHQVFHWAWIAGLTDGDGSFPVCTWTKTNGGKIIKPSYQIAMCHKPTMDYLAHVFDKKHRPINDKRKNRNVKYGIRLMSQELVKWVPHFVDYLIFKKERALNAIEAITLRATTPNGINIHPNLVKAAELIEKIKFQNQNSY